MLYGAVHIASHRRRLIIAMAHTITIDHRHDATVTVHLLQQLEIFDTQIIEKSHGDFVVHCRIKMKQKHEMRKKITEKTEYMSNKFRLNYMVNLRRWYSPNSFDCNWGDRRSDTVHESKTAK